MRLQIPVLLSFVRTLLTGALLAPLVFALSGCGGDDYQKEYDRDYVISGGGVDGPLTNASVAMYALLDSSGSRVVYSVAAPGTPVATGTTDDTAQIEDMLLNDGVNPPYILEFTSTASTIDLTTGEAPALNVLRTLVTQAMLDQGRPVYASPLTTIAVNIALDNADDSDGVVTPDEFVSALDNAASQVKSTLGFGMDASLDIFTLPPVLDDSVDVTDSATLQQIAFYRSAIEATRVLLQQIAALVDADGDTVLATLGQDLADDVIDGRVAGQRADLFADAQVQSDALALFAQTPSELCIARNEDGECLQTVGDIGDLLVSERADIGADTSTNVEVGAVVIAVPTLNTDRDGDGVNNDKDAFPEDAEESADTDADGVGDNGDNCPALANANQADTDSDGVGDACDSATNPSEDADRDGVPDRRDNCPQVANASQSNTDHDSQGNACDSDDDNDGVADTSDAFPLDADESADTDDDGTGDNGDNCPLTANEDQLNSDDDENGNVCDNNDDNDDLIDTEDNCPLVENNDQANFDEDAQGDACDTDDDNDGLSDVQEIMLGSDPNNADSDGDGHEDGGDNCPVDASDDFTDTDSDGRGDICDTDDDADGLSDAQEAELGTDPLDNDTDDDNDLDGVDNCKVDANSDQLNTDADSEGDVCDVDDDNDGRLDGEDAFPLDPDEQDDNDLDQVGNASDNCIDTANTDQSNVDHDTEGDVCDYDADNDGLGYDDEIALGTDPLDTDTDNDGDLDPQDNCPIASNANQLDTDLDGFGDACDDDDDNDGALDVDDAFPLNPNESVDTDSDAVGDGSDNCIDVPNANQLDTDSDGAGNACDDDDDNDGLSDIDEALIHSNPLLVDTDHDGDEDSNDNCILVSNASQSDTDGDGYGDACDPDG